MARGIPRNWRHALVYGLGVSGRAAARLLAARGVAVIGVDRRDAGELDLEDLGELPGLELELGREPQAPPPGVDLIVVSPGVPEERPLLAAARRGGVPVLAEVELAFRLLDGPVVGVTGSNGKSTTTALTGALLEAAGHVAEVCGNIGRPLSDCVDGPAGRIFVVELSSFQLSAVDSFRPRAAALLNLSPDHIDRHGDLARYLAAKERIFARQRRDDVAVLNADDPVVAAVATSSRRRFFSRLQAVEDGCYLRRGVVYERAPGVPEARLFEPGDLALAGEHNLENAMAAALLARALGAAAEAFPRALSGFRGLPHRLELVAEGGGVRWFDDSKATNVAAATRSLAGFADGSVHLILGGRSKGAEFEPIVVAAARKARRVYLVGEAAPELERLLRGRVELEIAGDLERAVAAAAAAAAAGEAVLLSPACASFDQYEDFSHRGRHFGALARRFAGAPDG